MNFTKTQKRLWATIGILCSVFIISLAVFFIRQNYLLDNYGVYVKGKVIGFYKHRSGKGAKTEFVFNSKKYYSFDLCGKYEEQYNDVVSIGRTVDVIVYPDDPTINEVEFEGIKFLKISDSIPKKN